MEKKFKSILLLDDNVADNRYTQIILEEMNIVQIIEIAENGMEALRKLTSTNRSGSTLILMDINMPKMNGWEFLEAYSQSGVHEKNKNVVVVLTSSMNPEDKLKAGEISCVAEFNIKPLTQGMFTNIIEKYSVDNYYE